MKALKNWNPLQLLFYFLGIIILAAGITLNTKSGLGVSPVISVAYVISVKTKIPLGSMSFYYYCFLILVQFILLRKDFKLFQLLQIGCSLFTSLFIGIFDNLFSNATDSLAIQFLVLFIAIFLTSTGVSLTVGMQVIPNPADGLADAIAKTTKKDLGFGKNLLDFTSILITLTLSFLLLGHIEGIGIGTLFTMILTGRFIAMERNFTKKLTEKVFSYNR